MIKRRNLILIFIITFLILYWVKNQYYINISDSIKLSDYFPFVLLKNKDDQVVSKRTFGRIVEESFESVISNVNWLKLWKEENSMAIQEYCNDGIDGSRCILITNNNEKIWSYTYKPLIEINPGDIFDFSAFCKKSSSAVKSAISISTYNKNKEIINWNYAKEYIVENNKWTKIQKRFSVPNTASYIRIRFIGRGKGKSWFDNVILFR